MDLLTPKVLMWLAGAGVCLSIYFGKNPITWLKSLRSNPSTSPVEPKEPIPLGELILHHAQAIERFAANNGDECCVKMAQDVVLHQTNLNDSLDTPKQPTGE